MKKIYHVLAVAALFVAAAALASCSKTESPIDQTTRQQPEGTQTIQFRATLAPKSEGADTKAITTDKDGDNKEILNVAWAEGEQVAIYYQKTDDTYATATATIGAPNADGSASFTASLPNAKNGGSAKFVYPASLANTEGDIDENRLLTKQRGILTHSGSGTDYSISKNFDAATATGTIVVTGSEATVSGTLSLANRVCICKISFSVEETGQISELEHVDIHIDGRTYSITPSKYAAEKCIYVAMLPCTNADAAFGAYNHGETSSSVTLYGQNYVAVSSGVTLEAGKFYRNIPIQCVMATEYSGTKTVTDNTRGTIVIPNNGAIILNNATVSSESVNGIWCEGDETNRRTIILLKGNNVVFSSNSGSCGIKSPKVGTLFICGNGSLNASAGPNSGSEKRGAAIGGRAEETLDFGRINIHGTIQNLSADGGVGAGTFGSIVEVIIDGVRNPTSESTYPHLTRSGDTWTHK